MLNTLRRRMANEDEGFTLIELMVVVLIIAILMAIAIPTFLGAQDRARDRGAQSNLRNAITAAKTLATDQAGYFINSAGAALTEGDLATAEPSLSFSGTAAVGTIDVIPDTVAPQGENTVFVTQSASNTFFCIAATSQGVVTYKSAATAAAVDTLAECDGLKW